MRWTEDDLRAVQGKKYKPPDKLNGWQLAEQAVLAETEDEGDFGKRVDKVLLGMGYIVLRLDNGGYNLNTIGAPDRMVAWPGKNRWVALELKRLRKPAPIRIGQQKLLDQGVSVVAKTIQEVLEEVKGLRDE